MAEARDPADLLRSPELLELLAAIEHERWAHWQEYLHSECVAQPDGSLVIPTDKVNRWRVQMETPYHLLSEAEKHSDREQVRIYLDALVEYLAARVANDG